MTQDIVNIVKLINLAEINLKVCEYIQGTLKDEYKLSGKNKFLILASNNAFHQAVGIIHGLLCSTKREDIKIRSILENVLKKEIIVSYNANEQAEATALLEQILNDYPAIDYCSYTFLNTDDQLIGDRLAFLRKLKRQDNFLLNKLKELKKQFENDDFHKIRHQTVAHKNKKLIEPAGAISLLVKKEYIPKLKKIIVELKVIVNYFGFDYALENNNSDVLTFLKDFLETE